MKKLILTLCVLFFSQQSFGADQTIEMLNKLGKEHMVYSKKIVNIEVGDTFQKFTIQHENRFIRTSFSP